MNNLCNLIRSSVGKKYLMAATGVGLGGFLLLHLGGNSTIFFGRGAFINYAEHLHSLGFLLHLAELALLTLFILHIYFGVTLYLANLQARPTPYTVKKNSGGSNSSWIMPLTGSIILLFILVHLQNFHFTDHSQPIADIVRNTLRLPALALFYLISLLALILHTSHGFWSIFQSLGLNHPNYNNSLKKGALLVSIAGGLLFILIPLLALGCRTFLQ